ncbi:MAG: hypothetical protein JWM27_4355 [Gemmatimonadetes bacterium]|nr:hypothetical protein [Gemmatimonadota bacterium]
MKIRIAIALLVLASTAACARDITGPRAAPAAATRDGQTSPDSASVHTDGGQMMGSGT